MADNGCGVCGVPTDLGDRFCRGCGHFLTDSSSASPSLVIDGSPQTTIVEHQPSEPPSWARPAAIAVGGILILFVLVGIYTGDDPKPVAEAEPAAPTTTVGSGPTTTLPADEGQTDQFDLSPSHDLEPTAGPPYLGTETGLTVAFRDGRGVQVLDLDSGERTLIAEARLGNAGSNLFTIAGDYVIAVDFTGEITAFPLDGSEPEPLVKGMGVVRDRVEGRFWILAPEGDVDLLALVEISEIVWVPNLIGPLEGAVEFMRAGDQGVLARNEFGTFAPVPVQGVTQVGPAEVGAANGDALLWEECTSDLSRCGWVVQGSATELEPVPVGRDLVGGEAGPQQPSLSPDGQWLARGTADPDTGEVTGFTSFANLLDGRIVAVPMESRRLAQVRWAPDSSWALWRQGRSLVAIHPDTGELRIIDVGIPADDRDLIVVNR
ncbi:MAG: hypothetical protein GY929_18710 [Actinomycetia bacterium]|nr:hypothetical protein [Actinomycetes bacterium]